MRWNRATYNKTQRNAKNMSFKKKCLDSCKPYNIRQIANNRNETNQNGMKPNKTQPMHTNLPNYFKNKPKPKNAVGRAKNNRGQPGSNRGQPGSNRGQPGKTSKTYNLPTIRSFFCMGSLPCPKHAIGIANCTNTTKLFKFEQFRPLWARLDMFGLVANCFHLFETVSSKICKLSLISNYLDLPGLF